MPRTVVTTALSPWPHAAFGHWGHLHAQCTKVCLHVHLSYHAALAMQFTVDWVLMCLLVAVFLLAKHACPREDKLCSLTPELSFSLPPSFPSCLTCNSCSVHGTAMETDPLNWLSLTGALINLSSPIRSRGDSLLAWQLSAVSFAVHYPSIDNLIAPRLLAPVPFCLEEINILEMYKTQYNWYKYETK